MFDEYDIEQIREHFGTPEQIALYFYDQNDLVELAKHVRIKKTLITIIIFAVIVALLMRKILLTIKVFQSKEVLGGYIINKTAVIEETVIHIINLL